jgi:RimJ/RimL family protein N-acetyltransferase
MAKADDLRQRIPVRVGPQSTSLAGLAELENLTTFRLCLGPVKTADYPAIASLNSDPAVQRFLCLSKAPPTYEEALADLPCLLSTPAPTGGGLWCIRSRAATDFLGLVLLLNTDDHTEVEFGYRLLPKFWGRGYATEAGRAVVNHAFGDLGLTALCAIIHPDNTASSTVAEKLGFAQKGHTTRLGFNLDHYMLRRDSLINGDDQEITTTN